MAEQKKMSLWKRMTTPIGEQIAGGDGTGVRFTSRYGFLGGGSLYNVIGAKPLAKYPVAGAVAVVDDGTPASRMTLTRIAGGAVLFGPVGAILGGLWEKDTTKVHLHVRLADGTGFVVEGTASDRATLQTFADRINEASAIPQP